jgi:8-oxo-dGTP diphosphatase
MTIHVVAGLVCQGSRLLVCQRRADVLYPLKWEFPGGKLEEGESLLTALRRELKEELGIEVESASELFRHSHSYPNQTVDLVFFKVETYHGSVSNKAFERVEWLDVRKLKGVDFLEGDLLLIEKLTSGELCL